MTEFVWHKGWNLIPVASSEQTAEAFIHECKQRRSQVISGLSRIAQGGNWRRLHKAAQAYIDCGSVKVAAVAVAARRKNTDWSAQRILSEAKTLNLRMPCDEPAFARFEEMGHDKSRLVVSFGPREFARQQIALDALRFRAHLHQNQFVCQGGMEAMQVWLHKYLPEYTHVLTTDFPCFFPNLNRKLVMETVRLPAAAIEEVLFAPMEKMEVKKPYHSPNYEKEKGLSFDVCGVRSGWGIPPGSALSSLAAECALRPILEAVEEKVPGIQVATYADNLIILATSKEDAEASKDALIATVEDDFHSRVVDGLRSRSKCSLLKDGFEFLGYRFQCDGEVHQDIHERRAELFIDRIHRDWWWTDGKSKDEVEIWFNNRITGYERAHHHARNVKEIVGHVRASIAPLLAK